MQRTVDIVTRSVYVLAAAFYLVLGIVVLRHYDHSLTFHWAVTFYLSLDAFVHWFTAYGTFEHEPRAIVNAIPFFLFLVLGLLRRTQPTPQLAPTRPV